MMYPLHLYVETLLRQGKGEESIKKLQAHLAEHPEDDHAKYLLAYSFYLTKKLPEARSVAELLFANNPEQTHLVSLLGEIDLAEQKHADAESKARFLISLDPNDVSAYLLLVRVKYLQGFYDGALEYLETALQLDPENKEALNLRVRIHDTIGNYDKARTSINELLNLDPENPTTLANHGLQLLNEGKVAESLNILSRALSLQPTNMLARHGMMEALKSRFWIYRLFYHYQKMMSRLSAGNSWIFIIGTYIVARILGGMANFAEGTLSILLNALVALIAVIFFLSWIINPLLNLVLSRNKYGRLLLDVNEKKMANLTGICLLLAGGFLLAYLTTNYDRLLLAGILFIGLMIPAGTYLNPDKADKQERLKNFGLVIVLLGLTAVFLGGGLLLILCFLGLFIYQFYYNKMMISDFSRKFEK